jgi:Fe2+ transport system protein FeoA
MAGERMAALGSSRQARRGARRAPFGGPLHLAVGPTELMIRRTDARAVLLDHVHAVKTGRRF